MTGKVWRARKGAKAANTGSSSFRAAVAPSLTLFDVVDRQAAHTA